MAAVKDVKNRIAIFAITQRGADTGRKLKTLLPGSNLYLPEKLSTAKSRGEVISPSLKSSVHRAFGTYSHLVLIMAAGIAVRLLAPVLKSKSADPGVVVLDESGKHVISLLSGHMGGANELTRNIAAMIGAEPVITTASDVIGTIQADMLGREFGWQIEDTHNLNQVIADIVAGKKVGIWQDAGERQWQNAFPELPLNIRTYPTLQGLARAKPSAALLISDRILSKIEREPLPDRALIYRPKSLVIGIGCNRGTAADDIQKAVESALNAHGLSSLCIRNLATIESKNDETGILEFARRCDLEIEYFSPQELARTKFPSLPSQLAEKHTGTPSVSEAAAILSSKGKIVVPKVSYRKAVTVAVARIDLSRKGTAGKGLIYVVGIGPGDAGQLTLDARLALERSDVILGYTTYMRLIKKLLPPGKKVVISGMGHEVERARQAADLAAGGSTVAVISSGDSGIYGMAGVVAEVVMERHKNRLKLEVIPGVPAFVAASALLGAPLMNDFVSISLSDHLVPWKDICKRLHLAAKGDFAIVLYNPRSQQRLTQFDHASDIVLKYRSPATPAGIVTSAYRDGQNVLITDLGHLAEHEIGMDSVVIIGNSQTIVSGGRMVTRRGYHKKYEL